jgi:hypothetical protein
VRISGSLPRFPTTMTLLTLPAITLSLAIPARLRGPRPTLAAVAALSMFY